MKTSPAEEGPWCDLHSHTLHSDGKDSPPDLLARARRAGASALAITDHDCVDAFRGAPPLGEGGEDPMEIVPGIELSCKSGSKEVHILGLFINPADPELLRKTKEWQKARKDRVLSMVKRLQACGFNLEPADVEAQARGESMGRPHIARAMMAKGLVSNVQEAFKRFLTRGKPGWVDKPMISVAEGIEAIHKAGGRASMAHPGLAGLDEEIRGFKDAGLDGIEVLHSDHGVAEVRRYTGLCQTLGLLPTGGSDDHGAGAGKGHIGEVRPPLAWLEALRP